MTAAERATLASRVAGSGYPLLLLNGYAAGKDDWDPIFLEGLAMSSMVLCPDPRGIGASPPLEEELTVSSMAADVLALMDAEGIGSADVAGWSMGGFVAQAVAARAPDRVRRLVLLSTDCGGQEAVRARADVWAALIDHSGTPREQATRMLGLLFPAELAAGMDEQFGEIVAAARAELDPATLTAQEAAMEAWHEEPSAARSEAIKAPTLIAAGTEDVVVPFTNSGLLADSIPGSSLVPFEGCGHALMAQEPELLASRIRDWIAA